MRKNIYSSPDESKVKGKKYSRKKRVSADGNEREMEKKKKREKVLRPVFFTTMMSSASRQILLS